VVYDSVGKDTFDKSLGCLEPFGLMACFGVDLFSLQFVPVWIRTLA
jgi:NADPH:quinone reductase-like Zn-dependent oxidoreductase